MHESVFLRTQTTAGRTYLLLVENERVDGRIKQRVLHRLGRLDQLQASGQLDALLASLGRFSTKLAVLGANERGESLATRTRSIGAALIFERLWRNMERGDAMQRRLLTLRFLMASDQSGSARQRATAASTSTSSTWKMARASGARRSR